MALTKSMNKAQTDIQVASAEWIEKLADVVKEYQNHIEGTARQRLELEKEKGKLAEDQDLVKAEKEMLSMQIDAIEEDIKAKTEREYGKRIVELERQNRVYNNKYQRQNEQIEEDKNIIDFLLATLGTTDKDEIVKILKQKEKEISKYKRIADEKIDKDEYNAVVAERDTALSINAELKRELSSERIEAVRQQAKDSDELMRKYNNALVDLESAKANINSLTTVNESYTRQIKTLTEEAKDPTKAFEFANAVEKDESLLIKSIKFSTPNSLAELADYVRRKMAMRKDGDDGFFYNEKTIKAFIAGLNMSPITILEGISGTGKTSLPIEFIKAITAANNIYEDSEEDIIPNSPYRKCPVQSGWRDNMDLMGYYNSFDCKYSETDFFKALYVANLPKYKNTLFFIILDEMNLSHPEHYFADFLSILEGKEKRKYINIKAPLGTLPDRIKGGMEIPNNVRFIGTANNDETTNSFAPKTYDRSNRIEMPRNRDENIKPTNLKYAISYEWLEKQFKDAEQKFSDKYETFKEFIEPKSEFSELLKQHNIGIGNRFADLQAKKFICAYIACGYNSDQDLAEAADHLITSRLLRVLERKYGLDYDSIDKFKERYVNMFKGHFGNDPEIGRDFLDELAMNVLSES